VQDDENPNPKTHLKNSKKKFTNLSETPDPIINLIARHKEEDGIIYQDTAGIGGTANPEDKREAMTNITTLLSESVADVIIVQFECGFIRAERELELTIFPLLAMIEKSISALEIAIKVIIVFTKCDTNSAWLAGGNRRENMKKNWLDALKSCFKYDTEKKTFPEDWQVYFVGYDMDDKKKTLRVSLHWKFRL